MPKRGLSACPILGSGDIRQEEGGKPGAIDRESTAASVLRLQKPLGTGSGGICGY